MNFSEAVEALKQGKKARRSVWRDSSSYIKQWMLYDESETVLEPVIIKNSEGSHKGKYEASFWDKDAKDWMIVD